MMSTPSLSRLPTALPMVQGEAGHSHLPLPSQAASLLLLLWYDVWPLLLAGQTLHLVGAPRPPTGALPPVVHTFHRVVSLYIQLCNVKIIKKNNLCFIRFIQLIYVSQFYEF